MNKQRIMSLFLALFLLASLTGHATAAEGGNASPMGAFADCDPEAWYAPAISYAVENEIMEGTGDNQMAPDRAISRAEFVTMMCRLLRTYVSADISQYEDLPTDAWYYNYMGMGLQLGIVQGVSHHEADPLGTLTREQAVVILARVLALPQEAADKLEGYTDKEEISGWAVSAVSAMTASGRLRGYPDGSLRPQQPITRAETARLLLNCFSALTTGATLQTASYEQDVALREIGKEKTLELKSLQVSGTLLLAPGVGDGQITLRGCQLGRLLCWGGRDIYLYPDCKVQEVIVARTDGPCTIHWLGTVSKLPKVTVVENSHPDNNVVDEEGKPFPDPEPIPEEKPKPSVDTRPKAYFIPQIGGAATSHSKYIDKDGFIQPMEPPVWEGHVFGGWYTEPECETRFSFDQPVTNGMKLYGKWYTDAEWVVMEQLNAFAGQGMARIQCETELLATIGSDKLPCQIHSHAANQTDLRVELVRNDTGEVVATIDRLSPGGTATEMAVIALPEYGNYHATLIFQDESGMKQAEMEATLYVAYLWNRGDLT